MHANKVTFVPDNEIAFAAAGARCNAGDTATISDVAMHLVHMDATLQSLAKNE